MLGSSISFLLLIDSNLVKLIHSIDWMIEAVQFAPSADIYALAVVFWEVSNIYLYFRCSMVQDVMYVSISLCVQRWRIECWQACTHGPTRNTPISNSTFKYWFKPRKVQCVWNWMFDHQHHYYFSILGLRPSMHKNTPPALAGKQFFCCIFVLFFESIFDLQIWLRECGRAMLRYVQLPPVYLIIIIVIDFWFSMFRIVGCIGCIAKEWRS